MKRALIGCLLATIVTATGTAQTPLPLPPEVEKQLAARASHVTEVTLGKNMLEFAAKFLNGKDADDQATKRLVESLDGIYVREYEFDKEGEYSQVDVDKLRAAFETPEWSPMVRERERKSGETTDVLVRLVNGEPHGMFILTAEARELTIVLIQGPIHMDDLSKLKGIGGLGVLGEVEKDARKKVKEAEKSEKAGKGGAE